MAAARISKTKKFLFLGVLILVALLLGEGLARLLTDPPGPAADEEHPYLRRVRRPDFSRELVSSLDQRRYTLQVDGFGFRSPHDVDPSRPKPAGVYRVFFVGGSTTENLVLPDEETFPWLVEQELNRRLSGGELSVQVFNTALSGNTVADSLSLVAHRILALEPDLVVVMHAINDMRIEMTSRFDPSHMSEGSQPPPARLGAWLDRRSRLLQLWARSKKFREGRNIRERYKKRMEGKPYSEGSNQGRGLPYFARNMRAVAALCRAEGVPVAFMTMPSLYKVDMSQEELDSLWMGYINDGELFLSPETLRRGMELYNARVRQLCQDEHLLLIDLEPQVPRDLSHFYDDCHYTTAGNQLVAEAIADAVWVEGDLPRAE